MASNSNVAYNHQLQTAHQRLSRRSVASPHPPVRPPPLPATPLQPQDPPVCDVFAALLFNRRHAYQGSSCVSSAPPSAPAAEAKKTKPAARKTGTRIYQTLPLPFKLHVHEEERNISKGHAPLPSDLKPAMLSKTPSVSRKRVRPAKKPPTEDAGKTTPDEPRKRGAPARVTSRATKRPKSEANTKQKLDHKGSMGNSMTKSDKDIEVITISDSEDDGYQSTRRGGLGREEGEGTEFAASKINIHEDEDDVKPAISTPVADASSIVFDHDPKWNFGGIGRSESESDLHPGPSKSNPHNDMASTEHLQEKELIAIKAEFEKLKMLHEKERSDSELIQVRASNIAKQEMQRTQQELKAEQRNARAIIGERDQLRINMDNSRAREDQLARELKEEKRLRQLEQREHESILEDIMKSKSKETTSSSSNDFLASEPSQQLLSPAPSSVTSSNPTTAVEKRKEENVRKAYSNIRKRFDILRLAARNLTNCTRGMDLTSFGQFGRYLGQLKTVLDEDGKKGVAKKEEDDAK